MPLRCSNTQARKLGKRLAASPHPSPDDLRSLQDILDSYGEALGEAQARLAAEIPGVDFVDRVKSWDTLVDKLRRDPATALTSIFDVAGLRTVLPAEVGRAEQRLLAEKIMAVFADSAKPPRLIDRIAEPSSGYRALHVVVAVQELPVEIQVRSHLQHIWAQLVETLADAWGRGIRYGGGPPDPDRDAGGVTRGALWNFVQAAGTIINAEEWMAETLEALRSGKVGSSATEIDDLLARNAAGAARFRELLERLLKIARLARL